MGGKTDALQQLEAFLTCRRLVALQNLYLGESQVFDNRQVREQLKVLKHHPDVRAQLGKIGFLIGDPGAVYQDLPLLYRLQTVDGFNQR